MNPRQGPERPRTTIFGFIEFCLRRLGVSPRPPYREGRAHGYTRAVPRCQGTSAGRSNLGVRHLAHRSARPSAFEAKRRRVCEKISNCTPFQSLCGFFVKRGLCLLTNDLKINPRFGMHTFPNICVQKSKVAHHVRSCITDFPSHVFFFIPKIVFT